jgi:ribulose-5-phosphate 4-epimerase/fuculose-1-phosphate aldolase
MIDGVIKYHVQHQDVPAPEFKGYTPLEALRTRLFALGLIGETYDGIGYGNLSFREPDSNQFFITATQTGKQASLAKEQYTFISGYDFEKFSVFSQGESKPSSEALSHAMVYEVHPEIKAVIHVHSSPLWNHMIKHGQLATKAEYGTAKMVLSLLVKP